jgi:hypothetical protein
VSCGAWLLILIWSSISNQPFPVWDCFGFFCTESPKSQDTPLSRSNLELLVIFVLHLFTRLWSPKEKFLEKGCLAGSNFWKTGAGIRTSGYEFMMASDLGLPHSQWNSDSFMHCTDEDGEAQGGEINGQGHISKERSYAWCGCTHL